MKKLALILNVSGLCILMLASCTDKKKKFKEELAKECIESGEKQFSDLKIKAEFRNYCECSAKKISESISREEFTKMKTEGREADMQARIMPVVEPCLNELQQKMGNVK